MDADTNLTPDDQQNGEDLPADTNQNEGVEGNTGSDVDKSTDPGPVPGEGDEQK